MPFVILPSGETRYYNGNGDQVIHYTGSDAFAAGGNTSGDSAMGQNSDPLSWDGLGALPGGGSVSGRVIDANPGWRRPTPASPNGGPPPTVHDNAAMALQFAQLHPGMLGGHFDQNLDVLRLAQSLGFNPAGPGGAGFTDGANPTISALPAPVQASPVQQLADVVSQIHSKIAAKRRLQQLNAGRGWVLP